MRESFTIRSPRQRLALFTLAFVLPMILTLVLLYRTSLLPIRVADYSQYHHSATLLPDGDVLIIGRRGIERYDFARDRWHKVGALPQDILRHTATLLPDGRVLVAGYQSRTASFFQIYDPQAGSWVAATHGPYDFYEHTATLLHDGTVLFAGGSSDGSTSSVSAARYDPRTDRWLPAASMVNPRAYHTATLLPDGRVLVVGPAIITGQTGGTRAEIYDPLTDRWREAANLQVTRVRIAATLLADGRVLVIGGDDAGTSEIYDPATDTWHLAAPLTTPRYWPIATLLTDGSVLVTGGQPEQGTNVGLDSAERYDPVTDRWTPVERMERPRYSHTATLLRDGRALVVDGEPIGEEESAQRYDPQTARWTMAGGVTVDPLWRVYVAVLPGAILFWALTLAAIQFNATRWGAWWYTLLRLHAHPLPLPRRAKLSLLSLYGIIFFAHLPGALLFLFLTSFGPPSRSHLPLIVATLLPLLGCILIYWRTRAALSPAAFPQPAVS